MIQDIFPHRFDNHYQSDRQVVEGDFLFCFKGNTLLMKTDGNQYHFPRKGELHGLAEDSITTFLFTLDEVPCFLVFDEPLNDDPAFCYKEISFFRTLNQPEIAWASVAGYHLMNWYNQNRFCGTCGGILQHKSDERAMACPSCHSVVYPKISPAIIVAILCNDKLLLARNANFPSAWFSLIAGYADVGESLEDTVRREVKEEVGLDVTNIRYYNSQPWPLSGSLMIGFIAEADDKQPIQIDAHEIAEAAWFSRGNLPSHPSTISIGGEMIDRFEKGELC